MNVLALNIIAMLISCVAFARAGKDVTNILIPNGSIEVKATRIYDVQVIGSPEVLGVFEKDNGMIVIIAGACNHIIEIETAKEAMKYEDQMANIVVDQIQKACEK